MNNPLVSVLMTAYNREAYLEEAMRSVLASTYRAFELIVVDDASSDRTFEIARAVASTDDRVRVYRNEYNLGQFPNRNKAVELANTDLIKFLDSDDLIYPHSLGLMVEAMSRFPEAGSAVQSVFGNEKRPYPYLQQPKESYIRHFAGDHFLMIGPSGWIFRRSVFESIQGYDNSNYVGSDVVFSLKLAAASPVVVLPPSLIWYREHEDQELKKGIETGEYEREHARMERQLVESDQAPLSRAEKEALLKYLDHSIARRSIGALLKGQIAKAGRLKRSASLSWLDLFSLGIHRAQLPGLLTDQLALGTDGPES